MSDFFKLQFKHLKFQKCLFSSTKFDSFNELYNKITDNFFF